MAICSVASFAWTARTLLNDGAQLGQHLIHDRLRNTFELAGVARTKIQCAGLVATHDACGAGSGTSERDRKTRCASEVAAARNRQYHWGFGQLIELSRRHDQHRPRPTLLVARAGIQRDEVDVATLDQSNSPPTGFASSHCRSSAVWSAEASHCASSSSSV